MHVVSHHHMDIDLEAVPYRSRYCSNRSRQYFRSASLKKIAGRWLPRQITW